MANEIGVSLLLIGRVCLAFYFIPSAIGKFGNYKQFISGVLAYQIIPEIQARTFAYVLPWLELTLGILLLLNIAPAFVTSLTAILLIGFIVAVSINLRRGREIKCSCYGIADTSTISFGTIIRNMLLLCISLASFMLSITQNMSLENRTIWPIPVQLLNPQSILPLLLLFAFLLLVIPLSEWLVDIHYRVRNLS